MLLVVADKRQSVYLILAVEGESEHGQTEMQIYFFGNKMEMEREELASLYILDGRQERPELFTFLLLI